MAISTDIIIIRMNRLVYIVFPPIITNKNSKLLEKYTIAKGESQ